jgi:hypothetical protein
MNAGHCMCILLRLRKKAVNEYCKAYIPHFGRGDLNNLRFC